MNIAGPWGGVPWREGFLPTRDVVAEGVGVIGGWGPPAGAVHNRCRWLYGIISACTVFVPGCQ